MALFVEQQQEGDIILVSPRGLRPCLNKLSQSLGSMSWSKTNHVIISVSPGLFIEAQKSKEKENHGVELLDFNELQKRLNTTYKSFKVLRRTNLPESFNYGFTSSAQYYYRQRYNIKFTKNRNKAIRDASYCSELVARIYKRAGLDLIPEISKLFYFKRVVWPLHLQKLNSEFWLDVTHEYLQEPNYRWSNEFIEKMINLARKSFLDVFEMQSYLQKEVPNIRIPSLDEAATLSAVAVNQHETLNGVFPEEKTFYDCFCRLLLNIQEDYKHQQEMKTPERLSYIFTADYPSPKLSSDAIILRARLRRHLSYLNKLSTLFPETDLNKSALVLENFDDCGNEHIATFFNAVSWLLRHYMLLGMHRFIYQTQQRNG